MSAKTAIKTVWLLILAAFLIGIGLAGVGVAFGGKVLTSAIPATFLDVRTGTFYDRGLNPLNAPGSSERTQLHDVAPVDVHTVSVSGVNARVSLVETDEDLEEGDQLSFSIVSNDLDNYRITNEGGVLSIEFRTRNFWSLPSLGWTQESPFDDITINIPRGSHLSDVSLLVVSGEINVASRMGVQIDRLTLDAVSGDLSVEGLGADSPSTLRINSVSGNTRIASSRLADLTVSQVSGSTWAEIVELDDLNMSFSTVSGSVFKNNERLLSGIGDLSLNGSGGSLNISTVSGNVDLHNITQEDFEQTMESRVNPQQDPTKYQDPTAQDDAGQPTTQEDTEQ